MLGLTSFLRYFSRAWQISENSSKLIGFLPVSFCL